MVSLVSYDRAMSVLKGDEAPPPRAAAPPTPRGGGEPRPVAVAARITDLRQVGLVALLLVSEDPEEREQSAANLRDFVRREGPKKDTWRQLADLFREAGQTTGATRQLIRNALVAPADLQDSLFRPIFQRIVEDVLVAERRPDDVRDRVAAFDVHSWSVITSLLPTDAVTRLCDLAQRHRLADLQLVCQRNVMPTLVAKMYAHSFRQHFHALGDSYIWLMTSVNRNRLQKWKSEPTATLTREQLFQQNLVDSILQIQTSKKTEDAVADVRRYTEETKKRSGGLRWAMALVVDVLSGGLR
jgi:hypothetical protein